MASISCKIKYLSSLSRLKFYDISTASTEIADTLKKQTVVVIKMIWQSLSTINFLHYTSILVSLRKIENNSHIGELKCCLFCIFEIIGRGTNNVTELLENCVIIDKNTFVECSNNKFYVMAWSVVFIYRKVYHVYSRNILYTIVWTYLSTLYQYMYIMPTRTLRFICDNVIRIKK